MVVMRDFEGEVSRGRDGRENPDLVTRSAPLAVLRASFGRF